jgi:hypothetical protein
MTTITTRPTNTSAPVHGSTMAEDPPPWRMLLPPRRRRAPGNRGGGRTAVLRSICRPSYLSVIRETWSCVFMRTPGWGLAPMAGDVLLGIR